MTKRNFFSTLALCGVIFAATSCNNHPNEAKFEAAINGYYEARPDCLWSQTKKLPAQAVTSGDAKTQGYDALTDAGLLTRTAAEKKELSDYDLSGQGRAAWTPDTTQPGYGNFCYGHRQVTSIDSSTSTKTSSGAQSAVVNYHYKINDVASWANSPEMKTAFPSLGDALSGPQAAQIALSSSSGDKWQVATPSS